MIHLVAGKLDSSQKHHLLEHQPIKAHLEIITGHYRHHHQETYQDLREDLDLAGNHIKVRKKLFQFPVDQLVVNKFNLMREDRHLL